MQLYLDKTWVLVLLLASCTLSLANKHTSDPHSQLVSALTACQSIADNELRLACYDALKQNDAQDGRPTVQVFPELMADLTEANLQISYGQLDLLGAQNKAFLMGVGKRQSVKTFSLNNDKALTFNVFGQISSQFDVDQLSTRNNRGGALINTDFSIGGELVQNLDSWSWRLSYTHKSTHLGDEFLIDNPEYQESRLNLSYEALRWTAAKSIKNFDLYAGLGFITRSEPGSLGKTMWQAGGQYKGQKTWLDWPQIRPVAGLDLKSWEASDWTINATFRAGIEVSQLTDLPFQLLFEYQDGHSPYGQFYTDDLSFWGLTFLQNW